MDQTVESFCAGVVELADTLDLGSSAQAWGFDSPLPHYFNPNIGPVNSILIFGRSLEGKFTT